MEAFFDPYFHSKLASLQYEHQTTLEEILLKLKLKKQDIKG